MINISFLEKKLNELEEGKYKKTLNGKTYDIEVKNENDKKIIRVYENNKLIINFDYDKNGIVKEGESNMSDVITLDDLIRKIFNLKEGFGGKDNISIEKSNDKAVIIDENYIYTFYYVNNKFCVNVKSNNLNFDLNIKKGEEEIKLMTFKKIKERYLLDKEGLRNLQTKKSYIIYKNTIMNKVDDKNYIGYNLDNDKLYLYTKRNDNESMDFDKDYLKVPYSNYFNKASDVCNTFLNGFKNKIKDTIKVSELNDLIDNIKVPKINDEYNKYIDEITDIANIYKEYIKYYNILDNDDLINILYNFVTSVNISIYGKKINDFKESIKERDLTSLEELYNLRSQIKEIIKLKKKENKPSILSLINKKNINK